MLRKQKGPYTPLDITHLPAIDEPTTIRRKKVATSQRLTHDPAFHPHQIPLNDISIDIVIAIYVNDFRTAAELSEQYNVSTTSVGTIRSNKHWLTRLLIPNNKKSRITPALAHQIYYSDLEYDAAAAHYDVSVTTVYAIRNNTHRFSLELKPRC